MATPEPPPLGTSALPGGTFAGQTVIVTGGGTGIGRAVAAEFTQSLAVEWASDGIRVNAVAPGAFPHGDQDAHWGDGKEDAARKRVASLPAGRVGRLHELGWAATFLCSPYARYITGHTLVVDGGNWLRRYGFATEPYTPPREIIAAQQATSANASANVPDAKRGAK